MILADIGKALQAIWHRFSGEHLFLTLPMPVVTDSISNWLSMIYKAGEQPLVIMCLAHASSDPLHVKGSAEWRALQNPS